MTRIDSLIEVNSIPVYVRMIKSFENRPTLVFLHDSLGCVQLWRDFPDKLCEEVKGNMLVYDRQGYGKSSSLPTHQRTNDYLEKEADTLRDLLVTLDVKDVVLFGHSDGGSIALIAAGKYPSLFKAVVVEAAHIFVEDVTLQGIKAAVREYATTNLKARLEKYHGDKTEALFKAWTETWLSENFRSWNIEHFLPHIQCPVLFIQGELDEYGTARQMQGVSTQVNARVDLHLIPATGHTPHKEAAVKVIEIVSGFLKA